MLHSRGFTESLRYTNKFLLPLGSIRLGVGMTFWQNSSNRIIPNNAFCLCNGFKIMPLLNIRLDGPVCKICINDEATPSMAFRNSMNHILNPQADAHEKPNDKGKKEGYAFLTHRTIH